MGRASKEKSSENRDAVISAAARLFRQRGIAAVTIADVMARAGLTHGAFYGQFASKEALAEEAVARAFEQAGRGWRSHDSGSGADRLARLARSYLSETALDDCPMPALASEIGRMPADSPLRRAYTAGVRDFAALLDRDGEGDRALSLLAALIGARVLRQAIDDPTLAAEIDAAVVRMAGERRPA